MKIEQHLAIAQRIIDSLALCGETDHEIKIEAAMLAGTHYLNAALHRLGTTQPDGDVMHTYLLTINEFRRLCVADQAAMAALSEIEDIRPPYVRGNWPGAEHAAGRALDLLEIVRAKALVNN